MFNVVAYISRSTKYNFLIIILMTTTMTIDQSIKTPLSLPQVVQKVTHLWTNVNIVPHKLQNTRYLYLYCSSNFNICY